MTGLDTIPSLGFDPSPRLRFHHPKAVDGYSGLPYMPYANACANILTVPVLSDYDFLRNESLQLSISVVFFLQMHKSMSPINVVQLNFDYYCCLGRFLRLSWYLNYEKLFIHFV